MLTETVFKPEHLYEISPQEQQRDTEFNEYNKALWIHPQIEKTAVTFKNESGDTVAIVGVFTVNPITKVGECCAILSSAVKPRDFFTGIRAVRELIDGSLKRNEYTRIQTYVQSSFRNARRLIDILGFHYEGTCENFGGENIDYDLYSRTTKDIKCLA